MSLVPVFFYWLIGAVMHHTEGHYDYTAGIYTVFFLITLGVMIRKPVSVIVTSKIWMIALSICVVLFSYTLCHKPLMIYANEQSEWMSAFRFMTGASLAFSVAMLGLSLIGLKTLTRQRAFRWLAAGAVLALLIAQILVPLISSHPWIDVWVNNTAAVDHFLKGVNPYTQNYPDIYKGTYDYKPGFLYFPGLLFWLAPFRALFGDIRYGFVFANLLVAIGTMGLAKKLKVAEPVRWLLALLWLSFPVTFFVLEQAWIDTILAALAILTFWCVEEKKWVLSGICVGAAFAVKQYGFIIGALALLQIYRNAGLKNSLRMAAAAAITFLVVVCPFMIWDWERFYASTIGDHTSAGVRMDAYNATIYLARTYNWLIPDFLRMAISGGGILLGMWLVFRNRRPGLAESATGMFAAYGFAFLFGKWAFCNYHYLLASLLLMYLIASSARIPGSRKVENVKSPT